MAIYLREQLQSLTENILNKQISPVYLIIGDRFLCQQCGKDICSALLAEGGTVHSINGDQEDITTTINKFRSYSLLPGRQVYKVTDSKIFHSKNIGNTLWKKALTANEENNPEKAARYLHSLLDIASTQIEDLNNDLSSISKTSWKKLFGFAMPDDDISWANNLLTRYIKDEKNEKKINHNDPENLLEQTITSGIPHNNTLVFISEVVDKRKHFYKFLKENHVVVDLTVDIGISSQAKKAQRPILLELIRKTLAEFNKTITDDLADKLIERTGFQPIALVLETEKLASYTGSRSTILKQDLDEIVARSRQEALFELTGVIGNHDLDKTLIVASRLLENGIHGLAIVATIRNFARNLLLFRTLQDQPQYGYSKNMQPALFQSRVLPKLKEMENWEKEISIHPYALYMQFKTAQSLSPATLRNWLVQLLDTEVKLKGSPFNVKLIIEHMLISILLNNDNSAKQA